MSSPYYVAPEQVMKDRADYARKGIARGRALVAVMYDNGIVLVAENPSNTLRKVVEIYDRIAFAGVGRYNEFDQLRVAGVRAADMKGYQYSRDDVEAPQPGQPVRPDSGAGLHPRDEADGSRDFGGRGRARRRRQPAVSHPLRRHDHGREALQRARRRRRCDHRSDERRRSRERRSRPISGVALAATQATDPRRLLVR